MHLVRNAIDHGIETPAERQAKGKQAGGQLTIAASQEGNSIVIRINDDGRAVLRQWIAAWNATRDSLQSVLEGIDP